MWSPTLVAFPLTSLRKLPHAVPSQSKSRTTADCIESSIVAAHKMATEQAPPEFFDAATSVEVSVVDEKRSSMLYNVLPVMLQSRLPMLPSIRHALSEMRTPPRSCSPMKSAPETPLPRSPPPGYTSRPTSIVGSQCSSDPSTFDSAEEDELFQEATETPLSSINTPPQFAISEMRTGIKWKYANQGESIPILPHLVQGGCRLTSCRCEPVCASLRGVTTHSPR